MARITSAAAFSKLQADSNYVVYKKSAPRRAKIAAKQKAEAERKQRNLAWYRNKGYKKNAPGSTKLFSKKKLILRHSFLN